MQTHKNPELRSSSVVKDSEKKPKSGTPVTTSTAHKIQKPPKCELVNNKWIIVSIERERYTQRYRDRVMYIMCVLLCAIFSFLLIATGDTHTHTMSNCVYFRSIKTIRMTLRLHPLTPKRRSIFTNVLGVQ